MSENNTTTVQKFEDGSEVPQPGFAPFATGGGGATIADTTNLIAGDGAGNGVDSGISQNSPGDGSIVVESLTVEGDSQFMDNVNIGGGGTLSIGSGEMTCDPEGNIDCASVTPANGFSGSGIFTTFTITSGIIINAS